MKKAIVLRPDFRILYFSGTGNTHWVAEQLKKSLKAGGFRVFSTAVDELLADAGRAYGQKEDRGKIVETLKKLAQPETTLILAFPAYFCEPPLPVKEMLELLPETKNCNLAVIVTVYRAGGEVHRLPGKLLAPKGYEPVLEAYVKMPNNIKLPNLEQYEILNGPELKSYLESAGQRVKELAGRLAAGKPDTEKAGVAEMIQGVSYRMSEVPVQKMFAGRMFAEARCKKCSFCASICPMGNITFARGYPEFGGDCCGCLLCYNLCPIFAIQITEATLDEKKYPRYRGFDGWHPRRLREVVKGDAPRG